MTTVLASSRGLRLRRGEYEALESCKLRDFSGLGSRRACLPAYAPATRPDATDLIGVTVSTVCDRGKVIYDACEVKVMVMGKRGVLSAEEV